MSSSLASGETASEEKEGARCKGCKGHARDQLIFVLPADGLVSEGDFRRGNAVDARCATVGHSALCAERLRCDEKRLRSVYRHIVDG